MVVGKGDGVNDTEGAGFEHVKKALRAGYAGEGKEGSVGGEFRQMKAAADEPDGGAGPKVAADAGLDLAAFFFAKDDGVSAVQGREWLAAVPDREEGVVEVLGREEDHVEGAGEAPVLEAVIEKVDAGGGGLLGGKAGGMALRAHPDRDTC
jgi:hypothetical protein